MLLHKVISCKFIDEVNQIMLDWINKTAKLLLMNVQKITKLDSKWKAGFVPYSNMIAFYGSLTPEETFDISCNLYI